MPHNTTPTCIGAKPRTYAAHAPTSCASALSPLALCIAPVSLHLILRSNTPTIGNTEVSSTVGASYFMT
ncbi:uncharacterized protein UDID_17095 [Ustilago sp. UG-2017a]|nr:uncharacterized protein UDID_17095 [Ustilago sp. UG-2017a]